MRKHCGWCKLYSRTMINKNCCLFFSPLTGQNFLYISVLNGFVGENANVSLAISYVSNLDTIFSILSFNNCYLFIRIQCE